MAPSLTYLSDPTPFAPMTEAYLAVRRQEGRLYDDALVAHLPSIDPGHPLAAEWAIRRRTMERLLAYLGQQLSPLTVLDVGCGNGWLIQNLASRLPHHQFQAVDVNEPELNQAARLFGDWPNLDFLFVDIFADVLPPHHFNVILLVGVIQYFPNLPDLIIHLRRLLTKAGEIHILDSPFYTTDTVQAARQRSLTHYQQLGDVSLADHYTHHLTTDLTPFQPKTLYDPHSLLNRLKRRLLGLVDSPFPWLRIRNVDK